MVLFYKGGHLAVGSVATSGTTDYGVFPNGGEVHIFVGNFTPHHPRIGADGDGGEGAAVKNLKVGEVVLSILFL